MSKAWEAGSDARWRRFRAGILRLDLPAERRPRCALQYPGVCTSVATSVDHIRPLALGGEKYDPANCRPSCKPCNTKRGKGIERHDPEPQPITRW